MSTPYIKAHGAAARQRVANAMRKARGTCPQGLMAEALGWSQAQLSRMERGKSAVTIEQLGEFACLCGMAPHDFLL